jgi:hypothetical protein
MINYTSIRLVLGVAALFGASEGIVTLTPGFPIAIPKTGCALVFGNAGAERGYLLRSATVTYFENGGEGRTAKAVFHPDGTFGTIISGLTPGATYQVLVEVVDSSSVEYRTRIRSTTLKAR